MKHGSRILIVEDDASIARLVQLELEYEGAEVRVVRDGEAGLAAALEFGPEAVILDIMLPGMDGVAVLRELRELRSSRAPSRKAEMFPLPCSPRATLRRTRYTAWTSAPTTTSPSPSTPASFWRGAQKEVELIAYEDLGAEAIRRLTVEEFPVTVVNDLYGGDLSTGRVERGGGDTLPTPRSLRATSIGPHTASRGAGGGR